MNPKINWDDPKFFSGRVETVADPPDEKAREDLLDRMSSKIHSCVNNTLRACGASVHEGESEATWAWVEALFQRMEAYIDRALRDRTDQIRFDKERAGEMAKMADETRRIINEWVAANIADKAEAGRMTVTLTCFAAVEGLSGERLRDGLEAAAKAFR